MTPGSRVVHHTCDESRAYGWDGIERTTYKPDDGTYLGISRQTLLGAGDDERALPHVTRYFEIAPGGYSTLERHEHPHSVVIVRGSGRVILDTNVHDVARLDCVYVSPGTLHQFHADTEGPLGFLCIVERERDRPRLPSEDDLERLGAVTNVAALMKARGHDETGDSR